MKKPDGGEPCARLPVPPYAHDVSARSAPLELDVAAIMQSDEWDATPSESRGWLLMLWLMSWKNVPCGSYANDDELIAADIGMDLGDFRASRHILLRDWVLHEDGRLYHPVTTACVQRLLKVRRQGERGYRRFLDEVVKRHGAKCWYCHKPVSETLALDHVVPRSRGGIDHPDNLVPACKPCNSSKGARTPDEWVVGNPRRRPAQ